MTFLHFLIVLKPQVVAQTWIRLSFFQQELKKRFRVFLEYSSVFTFLRK